MDGLSVLTNGSEVDKLKFLFKVYDVDGEPLARVSFNPSLPFCHFHEAEIGSGNESRHTPAP